MSNSKGKIYLLMGYLGSGKTTFIRNLLNNKQGIKYAVIQNQFAEGEMGIEQPLIMDESGVPFSNFLQLPNGCICCSAKNDLVASVQYILTNTDVKNVIVETNGLADPAESIKQFWFDEQMKINAELHSIISIISICKYKNLKQEQLFSKQIAYANKILLTFIDKSTEQQINQVEEAIREINEDCTLAKNDTYNIIKFLSGENMFDLQTLAPNKNHEHHHHNPHQGIDSVFLKGTLSLKQISQFEIRVGELLWESEYTGKIMRIKGAVSMSNKEGEGDKFVYELQGVDDIFEIKPTKTECEKFNWETRILVIGKELNREKLLGMLGFEC